MVNSQPAKDVLARIARGDFNESELAAFITVYLMRSVTIDELQGFRDALLELCVRVDLNGMETIDIWTMFKAGWTVTWTIRERSIAQSLRSITCCRPASRRGPFP